ncbi:MAG: YihY/virulence factor BrkB family protein [Thermoleophilaceae bacterium]|nr:YihY/virulence factor BrkB family protein [Thermoleophilaceae bacterium]
MALEHRDDRETVEAKREGRGAEEGRAPDSPRDVSFMATVKRTFKEFSADNITDWAAALTYYAVLAIFPAIIALVSIIGLVGDSATQTLLDNVGKVAPGPAKDIVTSAIENLASSKGAAGIAFVVGLVLALNSASSYISAFTRASNSIYDVEEGRPIWKLKPQQIGITLVLLLLLVAITVAVAVSGPLAKEVGKVVGASDSAVKIWDIAKIPIVLLVVAFMFAFLYKTAPNVKQPGFKFFSPGGMLALLVWIIASALFALYVAKFASYNKTYGAMGGVIVFLLWLWITNLAILFGAEFNSELQRSQQREAGEAAPLDEPFLEPRDTSKLDKKAEK